MNQKISRREALSELNALFAIPFIRWPERLADPLAGTIMEYQAGRARGDWSAAEVTRQALDRCDAWNGALYNIDQLSKTALDEAKASDARAHRGALRGPLDGVPVFAKAIYDMNGLPTTASSLTGGKFIAELASQIHEGEICGVRWGGRTWASLPRSR